MSNVPSFAVPNPALIRNLMTNELMTNQLVSISSAVFTVAFQNLDDLFKYIEVQCNKKKNGHRPDDGNVKVQSIEMKAGKMFCWLIKVRGKVEKVQRPVLVYVDRKNLLDEPSFVFND